MAKSEMKSEEKAELESRIKNASVALEALVNLASESNFWPTLAVYETIGLCACTIKSAEKRLEKITEQDSNVLAAP